jgi:predicted AAA+ superfamily ATPase
MIKRILLDELKSHLPNKQFSLIVGPRQAGKTTLMLQLQDHLKKKGEKSILLNLDIETDRIFFSSQEKLISKIRLELGSKKGFVFIDEIQRKENAGLFLKGIYDMRLPYKFIISGSGSIELKEKIHESLAGRKRLFELSTVTFREFIDFRTSYDYSDQIIEFYNIEKQKTQTLFDEYLYFGGYPRIIIAEPSEEKRKEMDEIYRSYIEKDISFLLKIQKTEKISDLMRLLASQIGRLVNHNEISNTLNIASDTLKKYLWYLEKTFIINRVNPFFKNVRKEITKSPVYYFHDIGLKNYSSGVFAATSDLPDQGFLFQNFIYNILRNIYPDGMASIKFWRTLDKAEVDFIVSSGENYVPIDVKYKSMKSPEINRSFRSFIKKYNPKMAIIVNLDYKDSVKIESTEVLFLPYYELENNIVV